MLVLKRNLVVPSNIAGGLEVASSEAGPFPSKLLEKEIKVTEDEFTEETL